MSPDEIRAAALDHGLPLIEDVIPSTAALDQGYLVVSGRAAMPLNAVSWSIDRSNDLAIFDEFGASLGTLCLKADGEQYVVAEMTRWQYTAYLADIDNGSVGAETHRFRQNYAIIDAPELNRYIEHYLSGSSIWGGFHHGSFKPPIDGWKSQIIAHPGLKMVTHHHETSFFRVAASTGPREQYLSLYHTIELLFDFITFRKFVKAGNDLNGFGKIMTGYQKSELDRLKSIIKEFCSDIPAIAIKIGMVLPYLDVAEGMFDAHHKDGNPFKDRWDKFRSLIETGSITPETAKVHTVIGNTSMFNDVIGNAAAYQIYRIRSSIAHSRVGEYILTDDDNDFVAKFAVPLVEAVAEQIFSSEALSELL